MPASNAYIIEAIREARGLIAVAARKLGIPRMTIYRRIQRCEKVREAVEDEREFTVNLANLAETKLYQAIDKGEPGQSR